MGLPHVALWVVAITSLLWLVPYRLLGGFRARAWHRFIPALFCSGLMALVYLKMVFISQGYAGIADMVLIILLGVSLAGLILLALVWS